jgi:hypothetical protein
VSIEAVHSSAWFPCAAAHSMPAAGGISKRIRGRAALTQIKAAAI